MSENACDADDEKRCPLLDSLKKFGDDLKASEVGDHVRNVHREGLMAIRSVLDVCIAQLEPREPEEAQPGRKVPVE